MSFVPAILATLRKRSSEVYEIKIGMRSVTQGCWVKGQLGVITPNVRVPMVLIVFSWDSWG